MNAETDEVDRLRAKVFKGVRCDGTRNDLSSLKALIQRTVVKNLKGKQKGWGLSV